MAETKSTIFRTAIRPSPDDRDFNVREVVRMQQTLIRTPDITNTIDHQQPSPRDDIRQLTHSQILAVWAAATVPMGVAAWVVAPRIADSLGTQGMFKALLLTLTAGLVWQFLLVMSLVGVEQNTLRWSAMRQALWLQSPRSPGTQRVGGRLWWMLVPCMLFFIAAGSIPALSHPGERDFGVVLQSDAGQAFLRGNWTWFAIAVALFVFNTALGEELLFRGYLLPRMEAAFGHRSWLANGVLFALYHVHVPWVIPVVLVAGTGGLAYPSHRYRSAWIGIIVHSIQTLVLIGLLLAVVWS